MAAQYIGRGEGPPGTGEKAVRVARRLDSAYGPVGPLEKRDLTREVIRAVLSQNTSGKNSERAWAGLTERFEGLEEMAGAPERDIEDAIRPGGLEHRKARVIKGILRQIAERTGGHSLEFVREMEVDPAREFLTSLPGVGPKTASVVLMFADGRGVLPVDTHVLRTSRRIGLVPSRAPAQKAQSLLEARVPPALRPGMHLHMVRLGREVCRARNPRHQACPVKDLCDSCPRVGGGGPEPPV